MKNNVIMINTKTIVWIWSRQWGLRLMKVMWLQEKGNAIETQGKNDHNMKATQLEVETMWAKYMNNATIWRLQI
jgi:hypothetical protein